MKVATMTDFDASPGYFIKDKREYPEQNLTCRLAQCDGLEALERAHKAVQYLAALDADHAQLANGRGFSKSDSTKGRNLARWPTERVIRSSILAPMAVGLARKYRGQLPLSLLVDKPAQGSLDL
jgi:hypothetical protein